MLLTETAWNCLDEMKSEQDLYSVLIPITWFCRISGIFPLRLKGSAGKRKYSTSYILIIYSVTVLVLSIAGLFVWIEYINETILPQWNRGVSMSSTYMEFIIQTLSTVVMIVPMIITRDKFADAIDTLSSLDTTLRELGIRLNYAADLKRNYIQLGINVLAMVMVSTYQFIYQLDFNLRYPLTWVAWMFPNVTRIVNTCLFGHLLFALRQRFAALNEHLRNMIEQKKYLSHETLSMMDNSSERLRLIARVNGALCEVALNVNKFFGLNIIIGVVCALKILTTSMYQIIHGLNDRIDISWLQIGGYFNRAMIGFAHIVYLVTACNLVKKQASVTGKLIHKFQINEDARPLNGVLRSFSLQLYHKRIEFTAAGVFPLDATLLQSIAGAVSTFLIISIQFDTLTPRETESRGGNNSLS